MKTRTTALLAGGAAAAVLVTGGVAVAATSTSSVTPGQGTAGTGAHHHHDGVGSTKIEHGQFALEDASGQQITRDVVNGAVTAVSSSSISVEDGTGTTTTFSVGQDTRVHRKGQAKGTTSTIAAIKTGAQVTVLGTGTGPYAANAVVTH